MSQMWFSSKHRKVVMKDIDYQYDYDEERGIIFECKEYIKA
jgi:hypothetical protein